MAEWETYNGPVGDGFGMPIGQSSDGSEKSGIVGSLTGLDTDTLDTIFNNGAGNSASYNAGKSSSANDKYWDLYVRTGDKEYLEKYLDNLISLENTASAREWQEKMSSTEWQRAFNDIEKAGYNPWLLLNAGGSGSSAGSVSAASHSSSAASAKIADREKGYSQMVLSLIASALMAMAIAV